MLPGPLDLHRCPACGKDFFDPTLASGNTIGARAWTDGKFDAPMLPETPPFVACPTCRAVLPLSPKKRLATIEIQMASITHPSTASWDAPTLTELLAARKEKAGGGPREMVFLLQLWRTANDAHRETPDEFTGFPPEVRAALARLAGLLDPDNEEQRLIAAELARELGDFALATTLLAEPFGPDLADLARQIAALVASQDPVVREIRE